MSQYYTWDKERDEVKLTSRGQWVQDGEDPDARRVALDTICGSQISTVFLGLNCQFGDGPPLLFETMVFFNKGSLGEYCERYSTPAEAREGHKRACALVHQEKH